MNISCLPKASLYHQYHGHTVYNIGELMSIHDQLIKCSLLADVLRLADKASDEEIIAYETWRAGIYNTVQKIIMGDLSNYSEHVVLRLTVLYTMVTYPSTRENCYLLHVIANALMRGKISVVTNAGALGANFMQLSFTASYDPWLKRLATVTLPKLIDYPSVESLMH